MYTTTEGSLNKMLELIEKAKEIKAQLTGLESEIEDLKKFSAVGDLVTFPKDRDSIRGLISKGVFKYSLTEMRNLIEIEENVKVLITQAQIVENSDITYNRGDVIVSKFPIHTINKGSRNVVLDQTGIERWMNDTEFLVLDNLDNQNYILVVNGNYGYGELLLFATKSQMDVLFDKTDKLSRHSFIKMEFSISGPDPVKYVDNLAQMKLFETPCKDREKSDYSYDWGSVHHSYLMSVGGDEVFGIMGTAYFKGEKKDNYESIVTIWNDLDTKAKTRKGSKHDANKIGFHKRDNETYRYDSNISYFVPNNYPKDVFTGSGTKDKLINILEFTQIIDVNKLQESKVQVTAQA